MCLYGLKTEKQATATLGEIGHQDQVFYNLSPVSFVTKYKSIKHFQRLLCVLKVPQVQRAYELLCDGYSAAPSTPPPHHHEPAASRFLLPMEENESEPQAAFLPL